MNNATQAAIKVLERSLYWQQHVLSASRNQAQKERCRQAITRLEAQIAALVNETIA